MFGLNCVLKIVIYIEFAKMRAMKKLTPFLKEKEIKLVDITMIICDRTERYFERSWY